MVLGEEGGGSQVCPCEVTVVCWHSPAFLGTLEQQHSAKNKAFTLRHNHALILALSFVRSRSGTCPKPCDLTVASGPPILQVLDTWGPCLPYRYHIGEEFSPELALPGFKPGLCHFLALLSWVGYPPSCHLLWVHCEAHTEHLAPRLGQTLREAGPRLQLSTSASVSADPTSTPGLICWPQEIVAPGWWPAWAGSSWL